MFVLILWFLAVLYSLFHLIIASAYLIHSLYSGAHEIIDKEIASFCDIFLVAGTTHKFEYKKISSRSLNLSRKRNFWRFLPIFTILHCQWLYLDVSLFHITAIYSLIDKNSKSFLLVIPAFFLILLSVHWLIFKLMQEATVEETEGVNEGKSLLNKGRPILLNETHNKELSTNPWS